MPQPVDPSQGPPKLDTPHHAIVRETLPTTPERAFALFTKSSELTQWFCHEAESDEKPGGEVRARWLDEDGDPWDRVGRWAAFEPPHLAVLEWFEVETAQDAPADDSDPSPRRINDVLRVAIAADEDGCTVTVMSPLVQTSGALPGAVALDAARHGWRMAFAELRELLAQQP